MKLNFKDIAGDIVKQSANDFIDDTIDNMLNKNSNTESAVITSSPSVKSKQSFIIDDSSLDSDNTYQEPQSSYTTYSSPSFTKSTKVSSADLAERVDVKNLFSLPSIITIAAFLLSVIFVDVDQALVDGNFSTREGIKIVYLLLGGVAQLVARNSENPTKVYTPHGIPGKDREDFIDDNQDGIDDRDQ